jgi:hypothetical protein
MRNTGVNGHCMSGAKMNVAHAWGMGSFWKWDKFSIIVYVFIYFRKNSSRRCLRIL